ncbi:3-hydroxypropionyl-coenzyme A dehydratase [Nymphon striatum]|nr:3-hydroxypropionyl-coenzyme A dehydratase [Nymphon striatum]
MSDRVTIEMTDGVADVRLNRPDKMNAIDGAMFKALAQAGESLKADNSLRAVVLSGEGRAFCAGLDFASFNKMAEDDSPRASNELEDLEGRITHRGQQAAYAWTELPVPVICAVTGVALGGGFQIAMGADIRIIAPDARMSVLEIRWGLIPDMTGTQTLVQHVGLDVAKELTFTGRMVEGPEAVALGLATRVSDTPLDDALAMAHEIAGKSPHAIRAAKRLLNNAEHLSTAERFQQERTEIGALIGSPNQAEAVLAYFEKRDPVFADPRAVSAADDILRNYQHIISDLKLVPATGGLFEVEVDGDLIYSKKSNGRHAEAGEVLGLFTDLVGPEVQRFPT